MLTQPLLQQLHELRLRGMATAFEQQLTTSTSNQMSFDERLGLLIQNEILERQLDEIAAAHRVGGNGDAVIQRVKKLGAAKACAGAGGEEYGDDRLLNTHSDLHYSGL